MRGSRVVFSEKKKNPSERFLPPPFPSCFLSLSQIDGGRKGIKFKREWEERRRGGDLSTILKISLNTRGKLETRDGGGKGGY